MALLAPSRAWPAGRTFANSIASSSRHASTSTSTAPARTGGSVQAADQELADLRRKEASMKRMGRGLDLTSMNIALLEPNVAPKFQWSWLFRIGGWKHLAQRVKGGYQDRQFLNAIINSGGMAKRKGKEPITSTYQAIRCFQPSYKAGMMLVESEEVYKAYNTALASGDETLLRKVASGPALSSALKLAKSNRQTMSWDLKRMNESPKVMVARMSQLNPEGTMHVAQVTVRFDSNQALTTTGRAGTQTKEQRVVEHLVLEKIMPDRGGWKVKDRPMVTTPDFAR